MEQFDIYTKHVLWINNKKNEMKRVIAAFVLIMTVLTGYGQESGKNFIDQNYIEVTGHADKEVTPDNIYLKFYINEKDFKKQTISEVETTMIRTLFDIGIDVDKNLTIKDYVSNFQHYWILKSDIRLIKEYGLLVNDAKTAGAVFNEFEKIGISTISIDRLEHSEMDKLELEVKVEAMQSAQQKAKAIAASVNQEIGRAILIQENPSSVHVNEVLQGRLSGLQIRDVVSLNQSARVKGENIEFEKIKLDYSVLARFELK